MTAPEEGKLGSGILSDDVESKMDAVDFEPRLARMRSAPTVWAATHRFAHTGLFCMPLNTSPGIANFAPDQTDSTRRFPELAQVMNLATSSPDLFESGLLSTNDCATEPEDSAHDWLVDTKMPEIPTPPLAAEVDSFSESLLKLDIPVFKQAPLSDQLRRLASDAARDGNEEIFALAQQCAEMLETGSTLRDVETCILERATNASNPLRQLYSRLLETAIPRIQTQIMVNEAQLCEDEALREVCRELAAVRIAVVERAVEMVSFILDEDTAVLLCKTPTSSWVQTTVRWFVCRGQLRFARFYVVLVLPAPSSKDMAVLLSALCRLSGGGLATALRIVPDASAAARLLRHILCTQCNVSHSTLSEDPASWSTETAHEALLRSMPDMNALRACRFVKGSGQDGKAGDPCTALLPANAQSALGRFFTQPITHGRSPSDNAPPH
ncbi:Hypothetical Protein FCC1311_068772 [Hondaea fermentalgiana]|uniref:Uncharacterized protein n=1 Tax=Hondaea fermentalgiana TaxID=2315210 RepID=A0A2R5GIE0_9STRA|nr:Hypothetical Protein FCC1311_068772 [Hondaea fermentalgiana]|eukprot:GBG30657.1 Hypothetical Protein FCC1311_068772 [Hondaea fermentalgiana]